MIKVHGLSTDEVQSIVRRGVPMKKKTPKQAEKWLPTMSGGLDEDGENLEEDDDWNDVIYEDGDQS